MSVDFFYPYRTYSNEVPLHLSTDPRDIGMGADGSLHLFGRSEEEIRVLLEPVITDVNLSLLLPPDEKAEHAIDWCLLVRSDASRRRHAIHRSSGYAEKGRIVFAAPFRLAEWSGSADLRVVALRKMQAATASAGFAVDRGAVLAASRVVKVDFTEPDVPPGNTLDVKWLKFSEDPRLSGYAGQLFAMREALPAPHVLLNLDRPYLHAILHSTGTRGTNARIRDYTMSLIAQQVWSSLLGTVFSELAAAAAEGETATLDALPEGWKRNVAEAWARKLFPDSNATAAVDRICQVSSSPNQLQELLVERLPLAVEEFTRLGERFDRLIAEVGGHE